MIDKKNRIQSVETAFLILNTIAENSGSMTLKELSEATKLPKNQLYRYLNSFQILYVLTRSNRDQWTLGPQLVALGSAANDAFELTHLASPHMISLRDDLNETVVLSTWKGNGPFFISWERSYKVANIVLDTWVTVPLFTATGKIYRAFLPEVVTNSLYSEEVASGKIIPEKYDLEIEQIRRTWIATTEGEFLKGISAISSPILNASAQLVGALTLVGVSDVLDISPNSLPAQKLLKTVFNLSRKLGYTGDFPLQK